jgi:ribosome production factor 1
VPGSKIEGHGKPTSHVPELILNNFGTRLGRRTGRFLGSMFPHVIGISSSDIFLHVFDDFMHVVRSHNWRAGK